jgi:phage-related protein
MAIWTFYDYVELTGRNSIREWLDSLPEADQAKIDYRLQQMAGMSPPWPEKWVSKYRGTKEIFEFRITGNKVQYRPLGTYLGEKKFVLLKGAIEKGDKIPKSDIETAEARLAAIREDSRHVTFHRFDDPDDLEEDEA